MNIHEYQAKTLLAQFGVPVPRGLLAESPAEARQAAQEIPGPVWVVKAQIHAGGRGKGGGVVVCKSPDEVEAAATASSACSLSPTRQGQKAKRCTRSG